MRLNYLIVTGLLLGSAFGCSSNPKQAEISSDLGPKQIIKQISSLKSDAEKKHGDLLLPKEFKKAEGYLNKAKEEAAGTDVDLNLIRENAAYSKTLYKKVISKSKKMSPDLEAMLNARTLALESGAKKYDQLKKELYKIDDDLRNESSDFKKVIDPKDFAEIQKRYLLLETAGIQKKKLSKSIALIAAAEDSGAKSKAPSSHAEAFKSLKVAENMISTSPSDSDRYKESVSKARKDSIFLVDVMDAMKNSKSKISEDVAKKLVKSKYKLEKQEKRIAELEGHLDEKDEENIETSKKLEKTARNYKFESIISETRQKFDDEEAEVFEREDDLVIRFKKPVFSKGSNNLNRKSMDLIEQLSSVLKKASVDEIIVEGHADSSGDESFSKALSSGKAEVVAKYLKSKKVAKKIEAKGKGSSDPIASNNTKKGREKNQRIDILVRIN